MKFEPHEYQRAGVQQIIDLPYVGLFWEMGLGKTVTTLTALNTLKLDRWEVSKILIVAPKKVAEATWQTEARRWEHLQHLTFSTITGTAAQRTRAINRPADIYVIGRDTIHWLVDYWRNDWPYDTVVLDESTSFKNPQSRRFKAMKLVRSRVRRLVLLTGTPAPNGIADLWAQVWLLDMGARLGKNISAFRQTFMSQDYARPGQQYHTYTPQQDAADRVKSLIGDICYSLKTEDHLQLPEYLTREVPVTLDRQAQSRYDKLERDMLLELDEETITAGSAAVLNGKLLQLCSGAVYGEDGATVDVHDCKLEALSELLEGLQGEHALVFYWFKHEVERITCVCPKGSRVRVYRDAEDERAWNAGEVDVLLAHPASCGYGLNLQHGGHHAVWYTLPNWALELYQQSNKRLHRQGQRSTVVVHHLLVQGGVDCDMSAALDGKRDTQEALMQALKTRLDKYR